MDFSSLFNDISAVLNYMLLLIGDFIAQISSYQLVIFALIIVVGLPAFGFVLDFIRDVNSDAGEVAENGFRTYRKYLKCSQKKAAQLEKENFKKIKEQKAINAQVHAYNLAQEFFKNNPDKMSISIMGFKFFQKDFEKKRWGSRRGSNSYSLSTSVNSSSRTVRSPSGKPVNIDIQADDE